MIVLDSDIVTLLSYGTNKGLETKVEQCDEPIAVTVITRMEILEGRFANIVKAAMEEELLTAMDRFTKSEQFLDSFVELGVNDAAARQFGAMLAAKKKSKMKRKDMLIACIALSNQAILVTRNVNDFAGVSGLRVEDWTK